VRWTGGSPSAGASWLLRTTIRYRSVSDCETRCRSSRRLGPTSTSEPLRLAAPWRTFRFYKGQTHYPGSFWSATERDLVLYESRLELTRLLFADFDAGSASPRRWSLSDYGESAAFGGRPDVDLVAEVVAGCVWVGVGEWT
jgi:hypothetical protein